MRHSFKGHFFKRRSWVAVAFAAAVPAILAGCSCGPTDSPTSPPHVRTAAEYAAIVSTFTIGSIALQTDDPKHVPDVLIGMTKLAPEEPAGWANLGLSQIRKNQLAEASRSLKKAQSLAPPSAGIEKLLAMVTDRAGDLNGTIAHLLKAVEVAPEDLKAQYSLVKQYERLNTPDGEAGMQKAIEAILAVQPNNLVAQLAMVRIASKRNDITAFKKVVSSLEVRSSTFGQEAMEKFSKVKAFAASGDARSAQIYSRFLENLLKGNSAYILGYTALDTPQNEAVGEPILQFIKLPPMPISPAPPDTGLTFASMPAIQTADKARWSIAGILYRDETDALAITESNGREVRFDSGVKLPFPGGANSVPPGAHGVLAIDVDFDLKSDLVFAGAGGLKIYHQSAKGDFSDTTAKSKLPPGVVNGAYTGAWSLDVEADGDLDVLLGSENGPPTVLRNSVDGTWTAIKPFTGISGVRDFAWADLDGDGAADAAMIDGAGRVHFFANIRAGLFRERTIPEKVGPAAALAAAAIDKSGHLSLFALMRDGAILRLSDLRHGEDWEVTEVARWANPPSDLAKGSAQLLVADLDNNGGMDLVTSTATTAQVWLSDDKYTFSPLAAPIPAAVFAIADIEHKGRMDLIGVSAEGAALRFANSGTKTYNYQEMRPRAHPTELVSHQKDIEALKNPGSSKTGDRRSNTFGIGGEIEARAGLLYQHQVITSPFLHVGLGTYSEVDSLRIIWPNGDVRSEFSHLSDAPLVPNSSVSMQHRLKGSCPWVFAWNGKKMDFVTDFLWRSPVGLRINAQDTAGIAQTEDWIKIAGDQLGPHDGYYDIRITAELWETHFFDFVRLMTVDHPAGTEIFVDERFSIPPPPLQVHLFETPKPVLRAIDDLGADVTEIVKARDGNYLDTFERGDYQGITRDHYVEFEAPASAIRKGPAYLIASGWIHPTDSSINVAISQGKHDPPRGLSLEVSDGKGGWRTAKAGLGFPAGKTKTVLIRLDDVTGAPQQTPNLRFRLRTNLEIYWDSLAIGREIAGRAPVTQRLPLQSAELRPRGYSTLTQANLSSPELPDYNQLDGRSQRWRDLIGYCTRFGDVRNLLSEVDDRYVIMNAGDEMALRFPVAPAPKPGLLRDYVLIGDGWEKDGDLNTAYSKTILPLPYHGQKSYNTPPGRLQDDPVVKRHPNDWKTYHTRYITPDAFRDALRPRN